MQILSIFSEVTTRKTKWPRFLAYPVELWPSKQELVIFYFSESVTYLCDFYRETLRVSAVFAVGQCLSVRPSVCLSTMFQKAEYIVKYLGPVAP